MSGHSWYPIEGLEGRSPLGITLGAQALLQWLEAEGIAEAGVLGFSQGGAIALQALRLEPERIRFAVNLSGYVAEGDLPRDADLRELRPPVFWGRGTADEVIPQARIVHTTDWLPAHADLSGRLYPGLGHAISLDELADIRTFLDKHLH